MNLSRIGIMKTRGGGTSENIPVVCQQCDDPMCADVCVMGAIARDPDNGILVINEDLCVGCKTCVSACPWGAPQWNQDTGKVEKCDYCMDRIDEGLKPACVTTCTTGCLKFGNVEDMTQIRRERYAASVASHENSSF